MNASLLAMTDAFAETVSQFDLPQEISEEEQRKLGERAALLTVAAFDWRRQIGPLFDVGTVKKLLGVKSRQAVFDLRSRARLLALELHGDEHVYPAFQFAANGRPFAVLPRILNEMKRADVSSHTIASWLTTPQRGLANKTPVAWMQEGLDDEQVVEAARRVAARLAR
jgi:hypothetical protein